MNNNISDKDKKDWENFLSSDEKLSNKDYLGYNNPVPKFDTISRNLYGLNNDKPDPNKKKQKTLLKFLPSLI